MKTDRLEVFTETFLDVATQTVDFTWSAQSVSLVNSIDKAQGNIVCQSLPNFTAFLSKLGSGVRFKRFDVKAYCIQQSGANGWFLMIDQQNIVLGYDRILFSGEAIPVNGIDLDMNILDIDSQGRNLTLFIPVTFDKSDVNGTGVPVAATTTNYTFGVTITVEYAR
jgi:hypothetical protein